MPTVKKAIKVTNFRIKRIFVGRQEKLNFNIQLFVCDKELQYFNLIITDSKKGNNLSLIQCFQ